MTPKPITPKPITTFAATTILLALATSRLAAAPQAAPDTRRFPGDREWVFSNQTPDGSLTLSTQSNDGKKVPFALMCQLGAADGRRRVTYSLQFQPPSTPDNDSSAPDFRLRIAHVWNPHFGHDFGPVSVHDDRAERVWVPRSFVRWLLFSQSCQPGARRNCTGNFQIETRFSDADPAKPQDGSTTLLFLQPPRSAAHLFSDRCASLGETPPGPARPQ